ncbi:MAG: hypothetical protein A3C02_03490 [Candidatus Andersenbacteria bacterium RIFCSPHIGHO2_02_FULL_45_11]|uniref:Transcriptional regulator, AbiEi antitoxin, Type IV TA system n=1 Tax=Candidatus Andersenbacteria bacterium RIFCSPHIGHO2_12_FULL_45_11 TaxID=1797281 RepID=A0A1G1X6P0_9BACT|nr:MAG: hypothetical protein A2805_03435 [Candidatus Andersenbacteria bacterium RIFCSPHIGHO2_01_FULL_46_36]OGY32065.1 MAG: hypothetical protein A3C02_03490 [Candidatus Andersenbacteria bacterium RIFCSPHIGHO2_02_FULL_45_11]OGY35027.1 MAG: hypothetical protein A3D99_00600 [Candidatus Andersenbacteria bacterium RIFCSPHIGHO2_12_FULL_45_11]
MENAIATLYQSQKTIFTIKDLALLWAEKDNNNLKSKIAYYVKKGSLIRLTRGVFARDKDYNLKELATSIYTPSYISFETVLRESAVIFQHYDTVFVASKWPKTVEIDTHSIQFRKLKDELLFNPKGIVNKGTYSIATVERAFLDMLYISKEYHFDNLRPIDWEKCFDLVDIYDNKKLVERLTSYRNAYAE